jgi:hypothetical protein
MLAFKFPDPCAGPFKRSATLFSPPNQLKSFQYAPVFDNDDECSAPLPLPGQLESPQYAPAFDSEDEYVTDDDTQSICSSLASEFSFRRRPIPVAPKNSVSLIALELDAIRKDNIGFEDGEWEDRDWDNHSDGDYAPLKEANLAAGIVHNEEWAVSRPNPNEPIEHPTGNHQETELAPSNNTTCAQAPRKTGLLAFAKKAITGFKWCGSNITRLCTKPKARQHTAPAAARTQDEVEADEEVNNPYKMFFGSAQDQDI